MGNRKWDSAVNPDTVKKERTRRWNETQDENPRRYEDRRGNGHGQQIQWRTASVTGREIGQEKKEELFLDVTTGQE